MAVTAHSDPYAIFMRKIGYSVGLENTLARLCDLQNLYLSTGDITLASWKELVRGQNGWNLKTENIADVFYSLRFIQCTPGDVLVLENLDALAIAHHLLDGESEKQAARSFVFLWAVLANDGELFVNMLLAGFRECQVKEKLSRLIRYKRRTLANTVLGRDAVKRLERVVSIERQESNKGSVGLGRSVASLKRTEPLQKSRSLESANSIGYATQFSSDYFRKVPPRRKDWARTLGLWSDDCGLTPLGLSFTDSLRSSGYISDKGIFTFWPMDYELVRSGFRPNLLASTKSLWETLLDFAAAFTGIRVKFYEPIDTDIFVDQLIKMMKVYRSFHTRKLMLRRELAITLAYPTIVAISCARGESCVDVPSALRPERGAVNRRVVFRKSRNTGGALSVKA